MDLSLAHTLIAEFWYLLPLFLMSCFWQGRNVTH